MKTLLSLLFVFVSFSAYCKTPPPHLEKEEKKHDHKKHDHSQQEAVLKRLSKTKMVVQVKGMVCAFCAQGIEKNFKKKKSVKSVNVDLDKMEVAIELNDGGLLSENEIKDVVTGAGFKYVGLKN